MNPIEVKLGRYLPIVTTSLVIIVLIICFILTRTNDIYVGGLDWPYFSDMGRDSPNYYVFAVGLTTVGLFLIIIWYINCKYQASLLKSLEPNYEKITVHTHRTNVGVKFIGIASAIGLPVLSIFDTSNHPTVHSYAAYWFFILEAVAILMNTFISYKVYCGKKNTSSQSEGHDLQLTGDCSSKKKVFYWQLVFVVLFWTSFIIYIPIGLAVSCPSVRLPIDECIRLELGADYCTNTVRHNDTTTVLWKYADCIGTNQMRTVGQLISILSLISYSISYTWHAYESEGHPAEHYVSAL